MMTAQTVMTTNLNRMCMRKLIRALNRYLFYLGAIPLFLLMIITVIDVTGRYLRHPLPGAMEITQVCLGLIVALTLAYIQARKAHIDIDLVFNFMPERAQAITNVVTSFLSLSITSLMAWAAIPWVSFSRGIREGTSILNLPVWVFKAAVLFGIFCFCLQFVLDIIDNSRELGRRVHVDAADVNQGGPGAID